MNEVEKMTTPTFPSNMTHPNPQENKRKIKDYMQATVTLTPDFIKLRSNKKEIKFKITHDKAIELLMKWEIPMGTFLFLESLPQEDRDWVISECERVIGSRQKTNESLLKEIEANNPKETKESEL